MDAVLRLRWPLALTLLLVLAALAPLADASPVDPIWIGGVYDGDDLDDVVLAVFSTEGMHELPVILPIRPAALGLLPVPVAERPGALARPASRTRAPPGA